MAAAHAGVNLPISMMLLFCALAWLSGALFGYGLRELPRLVSALGGRRFFKRRRKRTGYYFSEDQRTYRDRRWRAQLGWISFVLLSSLVLISATLVAANMKSRPNPAAAMRHRWGG